MEGRVWTMVAVFLLIAGGVAGVSLVTDIEAKKQDLADAKAELKNMEEEIENKNTNNARSQESYETLKGIVDRHASAGSRKKDLEREIVDLEEQKKALLKSFKDAVVQVRSASVGMTWPDFNHANGQALSGVKIQKATDTEVTVSHSEGVVKLSGETLTPELKSRFRIGMVPVVEAGK